MMIHSSQSAVVQPGKATWTLSLPGAGTVTVTIDAPFPVLASVNLSVDGGPNSGDIASNTLKGDDDSLKANV